VILHCSHDVARLRLLQWRVSRNGVQCDQQIQKPPGIANAASTAGNPKAS
jgi:hypothetical protein